MLPNHGGLIKLTIFDSDVLQYSLISFEACNVFPDAQIGPAFALARD